MIIDSAQYRVLSDNPAYANGTVVHVVRHWPRDGELAAIAMQSPCHETTFLRHCAGGVELRWFARDIEVPLCGHGALAAAHHLLGAMADEATIMVCNKQGRVQLARRQGAAALVFPPTVLAPARAALPQAPFACTAYDAGRDYLFFTEDHAAFQRFDPAHSNLASLDKIGVLLVTRCAGADFQFRFFAPKAGIAEDGASASVAPALVALAGLEEGRSYRFTQGQDATVCLEAAVRDGQVWLGGHVERVPAAHHIHPTN